MSDRADADKTTGGVERVLYTTKYDAETNFILFAVAVELNALDERQGTATIPAARGGRPKNPRSDERQRRHRRCEMQSIRVFTSA